LYSGSYYDDVSVAANRTFFKIWRGVDKWLWMVEARPAHE